MAKEKSALAAHAVDIKVAQLCFAAAFDSVRDQLQTDMSTAQATAEAAIKTAQENFE